MTQPANTLPTNEAVIERMSELVLAGVPSLKKSFTYVPMLVSKADLPCVIFVLDEETANTDDFGRKNVLKENSTYLLLVLHAELTVKREGEASKTANAIHRVMKPFLASQEGLSNGLVNLVTSSAYQGNNGIKPTSYPAESGNIYLATEYRLTVETLTLLKRRS